MRNIWRDIGVLLALFVVSASLLWLYKKYKEDVLSYSLDLMGTKLLAMVPEGEGKQAIEDAYNSFVEKVKEHKVAPEAVENVAANILNLSNNEATLTPDQAESVISLSMLAPEAALATPPTSEKSWHWQHPALADSQPPPPDPKRFVDLGNRLKTLYEFNGIVAKIARRHPALPRDILRQMRYQSHQGLQLAIDARLKNQLSEKEYQQLVEELQQLENERLVVWQADLDNTLQKEQQKIQESLQQVHEELMALQEKKLAGMDQLAAAQEIDLSQLAKLDVLKNLPAIYMPPFPADSINKIIAASMKAAGVADSITRVIIMPKKRAATRTHE